MFDREPCERRIFARELREKTRMKSLSIRVDLRYSRAKYSAIKNTFGSFRVFRGQSS
jgi:hypothetical protein